MIRAVHLLRPVRENEIGGDLVQLRATVSALQSEGIDAAVATREDSPQRADIVHLYNLLLPSLLVRDFQWARQRWPRAQIVISPIFWPLNMTSILRSGESELWLRGCRRALKARLTWMQCRRVLSHAAAILPSSANELRRTARYFHIRDVTHWHAVPNGIWIDEWPMARGRDDGRSEVLAGLGMTADVRVVVACVARLETRKNQRALVRAVARLSDAALILVGPRPNERRSERRYADSMLRFAGRALHGRFAWLGGLDRENVRQVLGQVDVHVLPSFFDIPGLSSLEAAASGCEIVATREGSAEEYFGDLAQYAEPYSASSIAAAIERATSGPKQPRLRARVEQYDWSSAARILANVYRTIT